MKVVLVRFKDDERREFSLDDETSVIGRRPDCALRVPTRDVSRQHCEIRVSRDEVRVKDLGSSNGTFVNGTRVAETALKAGDRLSVGPVVFVVQIDGKPEQIEPLDADSELAVGLEPEGEELVDLDEADFDLDDPITALEALDEEEDEDDEA